MGLIANGGIKTSSGKSEQPLALDCATPALLCEVGLFSRSGCLPPTMPSSDGPSRDLDGVPLR